MNLRRLPSPPVTAQSEVWDTPSGLGGTWTVQIVDRDGPRVLVQTIYGTLHEMTGQFVPWDDCLEFWTTEDQLSNRRTFRKRRPT